MNLLKIVGRLCAIKIATATDHSVKGMYPLTVSGTYRSDNPTINSSLVRYESYCRHKPHGISKPPFPSTKGYLPSITSISKIQYILQ